MAGRTNSRWLKIMSDEQIENCIFSMQDVASALSNMGRAFPGAVGFETRQTCKKTGKRATQIPMVGVTDDGCWVMVASPDFQQSNPLRTGPTFRSLKKLTRVQVLGCDLDPCRSHFYPANET
jgi:hypothetical protein